METRARYALIGLFMLAVILASFAFVYWLENKGGFGEREIYDVRFEGSVSGLLVGSSVLFNGIRVGEVTRLALNPAKPQEVIATLSVVKNTPIRSDTDVEIQSQGLTGGVAVVLQGGSADSGPPPSEGSGPPTLTAGPGAADWTQAARDAFQRVDDVLAKNAEALNSAITNIDTFSDALARNSNKVDGILAGLERMTGGGGAGGSGSPLYSLAAVTSTSPATDKTASWQLIVPEPSTLMSFNTDKILLRPAADESMPLENARWSDNLTVMFQTKVLQSFENAGYAKFVSRTSDSIDSNYQLPIDIRRFHISTSGEPTAEISFLAKVVSPEGKIIDARLFEGSAPAEGTGAKTYVEALSGVFVKLETELVDWAASTLDAAPPPPAPKAPPGDMPETPGPGDMPPAPEGEPAQPAPDNAPPVTVEPPAAPDQPTP